MVSNNYFITFTKATFVTPISITKQSLASIYKITSNGISISVYETSVHKFTVKLCHVYTSVFSHQPPTKSLLKRPGESKTLPPTKSLLSCPSNKAPKPAADDQDLQPMEGIQQLPADVLVSVISRAAAGPRDACIAATVSPAFRAAADSDTVWSRFLPADLAPLVYPTPPPRSKKELFLRLSETHALVEDGLMVGCADSYIRNKQT
jgi:hypothetical protein